MGDCRIIASSARASVQLTVMGEFWVENGL